MIVKRSVFRVMKIEGNGPDWAKQSKDNIEVECRDGGNLQYSGSLFRNLSAIMTGRTEDKRTTKQINGPVLSFKKLATNQMNDLKTESVKIVFQIFNSSLDYPICSYWKKDEHGSNGQWLGDGCWLEDFNRSSGLVTCACSHLTNFAVLMSPSVTVSKIHHQALSAITVVGCTLSMTGLVATAIAYLYFWRLVKSDRATLLIHLCVTLFVAYLVFLIGIQRTEYTVTCTSIAVVLHYVYLVAFFIMLAEGGVISLMVLRPLGKKDVVSFFLGASYGIPLIIVGISIGVTQFRGYGNERFCWLTVETGLFWAFAGPVLAIVAANMVITVLVLKQLFGVSAMAKRKDVEKIKTGVRSVCILLPVLGLTWVFGIFAVNRDTIFFQYLFAIFNSLQGFLIFIVQCVFDRKVCDAFRQARIRIPLFTTTTDVRTVETEMKSTQKSSSHKGSASTSGE
ncbi:adhesion G protein-coupled receptor E5-like [Dreissena polymorpha]|uniref:adhesion G protein-coupled receptor E5-like n=1 Tax=Dreissena polymorpha TaxID=45954 RepID=UPI00226478C9|nr:adhesion G protein-coupled receptor E5-like [Dreissena polymorpha]